MKPTPAAPPLAAPASPAPEAPRRWRRLPAETGVMAVLAVMAVWLAWAFPTYRGVVGLPIILNNSAEIAIVAAGMTLVIATGGIDISVGSVVGLAGIVLGVLAGQHGWNVWAAGAAAIATGAACGLVNGVLVARCGFPSIIATLATFSAARAGAYVLSHGTSISNLPPGIISLGFGSWLGIPIPAWVAAGCLLAVWVLLRRTRFGRGVLALGGNREASYLSGLRVARTEVAVYALSGLFAGIAAVVVTAKGATAVPDAGMFYEMRAITAVVMGGTPVVGGSATAIGTALGALTIGTIQSGVVSYGRDAIWEMLILAVVLLLSVEVDRWRRAK